VVGRELGRTVAHLLADPVHRRDRHLAAEGLARDRLAARREHADGAADRRRQGAYHLVEAALVQHEPLEALVDGDAALEDLVLLVDEPRERLLRQRDEGQLVRDLEDGEADGGGLLHKRGRQCIVVEASAEPETCEVAPRQEPHELALPGVALELDAGGQQELAAREPWGGVGQLGDVDPANRGIGAVAAHRELETHLRDESPNGEHHSTCGRAPASLSAGRSAPRRR
jgi:hypothetical protein